MDGSWQRPVAEAAQALSRRGFVLGALGALGVAAGAPAAAEIFPLPPAPLPLPPLPPLPITPFNYHSPPLEPFADPLPIPETRPAAGELVAASGVHRYHRDLPETRSWGFSRPVLGPTLEAHRGRPAHITFRNELGPHVLAAHVDTGMHATTDLDRTDPRMTVHLHGAHNHPDFDGHPLITWRNGGRIRNWYGNRQQATTLWYHDHAMGITRLNLQAGLAGMYYLRDEFDTGAPDNPLGLPTGEYEIPLIVQDRTFNPDGSLQPMVGTYIAEGYNQSGQFGDVACVNGVAWPSLPVRRTLYRFRLLQASNSRTYTFEFDNRMPFWVIGNDLGLLDAPVPTTAVRLSSGERADLLVDFSGLRDGESVELTNTELNDFGNTVFMVPALPRIMRFTVAGDGPAAAVPARLRGGDGQPAPLEPLDAPQLTRTMTMMGLTDTLRPPFASTLLALNNLPFRTTDVDVAKAGTVEQWDLINATPFDHPIHLHLARMRILGRQPILTSAYWLSNSPGPAWGTRWNPPADAFVRGPQQPPQPWETGWKDTVLCPTDAITRVLVYWPSIDELGFDPDTPLRVRDGAEAIAPYGDPAPRHHANHTDATTIRGYVWHCHNLDHEDHDMMQQIRITA
ncbi:Multicopper oxidase with three cupredoxin domains (includes cell division protein FtsP and spore coat protein CotA) [Nocardia amikacinitolerans]|uniref:multicopper oxidase family protein n=1 Tax=Nocardia amikacinitolerans TaxID=756689 RepID=UPI0020A4EC79|nr:multicopper oxidase domain-containing protein [Nocardia amikacinitolerans]MCP2296724.1 Multicopper oxidase with three cupredoxin domains (includes cell division protein FtsP and spore coat protein CotA) [Nocardia amikacinitolerans]